MIRALKRFVRRQRGATFFGVMIATVIISLAALPLISTVIDQTKLTRVSKMRVFASHLAHNMIERFRTEHFQQVATYLSSPEGSAMFIEQDELLTPTDVPASYSRLMRSFTRELVLIPVTDRSGVLEATVKWREDGHDRKVRVSTVIVDADFPGGKPMAPGGAQ